MKVFAVLSLYTLYCTTAILNSLCAPSMENTEAHIVLLC